MVPSWITFHLVLFSSINFIHFVNSLKETDCEVCFGAVNKLIQSLDKNETSDVTKIETKLFEMCKDMKKAENRFCYYIGALEESATKIVSELSKPLSWGLPVDKICERLKKKDNQICELRYEKQIDLNNVDLKKLRVRDLKKILSTWDERCDGCIEKAEFIKKIEEVKSKYVKTEL